MRHFLFHPTASASIFVTPGKTQDVDLLSADEHFGVLQEHPSPWSS
jgi:hypothetical protein